MVGASKFPTRADVLKAIGPHGKPAAFIMQSQMITGLHGYKNTGIQDYRNTGIQENRITGTQEYRNTY